MVDIKTTRDYKVENNDFIAIRTEEYDRDGHKMVQTLEEHNITIEEMNIVLDKEVPTKEKEFIDETRKLNLEIETTQEEIKSVVESDAWKAYKSYLSSEEFKKFLEVSGKVKAIELGRKRLDEIKKESLDLDTWKVQMTGLRNLYKETQSE